MKFNVYSKANKEIYLGIVKPLSYEDITKLEGEHWYFDWKAEYHKQNRHVYKLVIEEKIESLISFEYDEGFILVEFLETAPHNRKGNGMKAGAPLIAFTCLESFEKGLDGYVVIKIKWNEKLIRYYEDLGAKVFSIGRMGFHPVESWKLVNIYLVKGE